MFEQIKKAIWENIVDYERKKEENIIDIIMGDNGEKIADVICDELDKLTQNKDNTWCMITAGGLWRTEINTFVAVLYNMDKLKSFTNIELGELLYRYIIQRLYDYDGGGILEDITQFICKKCNYQVDAIWDGDMCILCGVRNYSILMCALENDNIDKVIQLIDAKDVNYQNVHGETALMIASRKGYIGAVNLLIENGADLNTTDKYGQTASNVAVKNKHLDIVSLLIKKGVDINI